MGEVNRIVYSVLSRALRPYSTMRGKHVRALPVNLVCCSINSFSDSLLDKHTVCLSILSIHSSIFPLPSLFSHIFSVLWLTSIRPLFLAFQPVFHSKKQQTESTSCVFILKPNLWELEDDRGWAGDEYRMSDCRYDNLLVYISSVFIEVYIHAYYCYPFIYCCYHHSFHIIRTIHTQWNKSRREEEEMKSVKITEGITDTDGIEREATNNGKTTRSEWRASIQSYTYSTTGWWIHIFSFHHVDRLRV